MTKVTKRTLSLILITLLLLPAIFGLSACSEDNGNTVTLYVYNWGEYISDGSFGELDTNKVS